MKPLALSAITATAVMMAFAPGVVLGDPMEKKGTTPYVTHFVFRPLMSLDVLPLGTATLLEAVGTTENMKGEKMFDKMSARCTALSAPRATRNISTAPAYWLIATVTKSSRPLIRVTWISQWGRRVLVAPISSRAALANTRESPGASHSLATRCLHWLALVGIPPWTSRITRPGRSKNKTSLSLANPARA